MPAGSVHSKTCPPRSNLDCKPVWLVALGRARAWIHRGLDLDRHLATSFGHFDVDAAETQSSANRSNPGNDLRLDAMGVYVYAWRLRIRARGLLDCQQHDHLYSAIFDHAQPRGQTRCLWQY